MNYSDSVSQDRREEFLALPSLKVTCQGGIALLTLDAPSCLNSLSRAMVMSLGVAARRAIVDPAIRAIVLTGMGNKAFCAGADLKERQEMTEQEVQEQLECYEKGFSPLAHSPKPVIAAINGIALGGGVELALLCDLRVAVPHAQFGFPEISLGIIPGAGGTQRLPRLIGEGRAKEMILLGSRIDAFQACAWGLINHVLPEGEDVVQGTLDWIEPIMQGAPLAQAAALRAIDQTSEVGLAEGLIKEREQYARVLSTWDRKEALQAFQERRKPSFRGE
ncbi:enoyl-CoA hydratase-related protein [Pajaroellobacter abortibovis]|uniref:Enoyl-CoA hydratase n=1 Tax=Pajaroellobacter abortibovis TaxID=1882918 RepID=A0A1L6MYF6_9BACT|nr:enoyl-CoA hydratase-related protein [Pajaroellobacter abortibovis]APS00601.1 enoyl-CoA hydratase [Pajaroellobacter abortibovis]